MAVLDAYSPCPCGSGQKYKWCCQKVEAYADRAQRLFETGQAETALGALEEGLRKEPGNAWLLNRKAIYQVRMGRTEDAKATLHAVLKSAPGHLGSLILMTRLVLETEGASAGAAQLQQALTAYPPDKRADLAALVKVVGAFLSESGEFPAAVRHLKLAQALTGGEPDPALSGTIRMIEGNPDIPPWQKNPDALTPPPDALNGPARARFEEALGWAEEGLWSSAAAAFDALSSDRVAGPLADRNCGFCRLWLADDSGAATALRRYAATLGDTTEAVDLEALCQSIAPPGGVDLVEVVSLTWPVRNRSLLLERLKGDPSVHSEGPGPSDPEDPESPEAEHFALLDRPAGAKAHPGLKPADVPKVVGSVLLGQNTVSLEAFDDGRLDALSDRFMALAAHGIPPAHPKTKLLSRLPRLQVALTWEWVLPEGLDRETVRRLNSEQGAALVREAWPNTRMSALHGRTPAEAARAGDSVVPLRAALRLLEQSRESWREGFDFAAFRAGLGVGLEPPVDPSTTDLATLHLARLDHVPAQALDDAKLVALYRRARQAVIPDALEHAAEELARRPTAFESQGVKPTGVFSDLAMLAATRLKRDAAFDWVRKGREAEPAAKRARNLALWDMLEVRLRTQLDEPELWVPELAVVLERYREDPAGSQSIMMNLIDMGLLRMVQNPDKPGEVVLDSRGLQALLAEYGPRITTASGRLGVSATKPDIWAPGGPAQPGGKPALWTPGSGGPSNQPGGGSKLIIPGR